VTEASKRLEYGEIGFPRTILVDTLAMTDPQDFTRRHLCDKRIDQGCLANTGLPYDDPDLAGALPGRRPPLG
jgi:hypothetical protein